MRAGYEEGEKDKAQGEGREVTTTDIYKFRKSLPFTTALIVAGQIR